MAHGAGAQPPSFSTRCAGAGCFASHAPVRRGRAVSSPPQFGQRPPSTRAAQSAQNVHSNEQIRASSDSGGRSALQHSQLGLSWSMSMSHGVYPGGAPAGRGHADFMGISQVATCVVQLWSGPGRRAFLCPVRVTRRHFSFRRGSGSGGQKGGRPGPEVSRDVYMPPHGSHGRALDARFIPSRCHAP
jgi:hypothetical protein